jgi:hypothetical protein
VPARLSHAAVLIKTDLLAQSNHGNNFLVNSEAVPMPKKARESPISSRLEAGKPALRCPTPKVACELAATSVYSLTGVNAETDRYVPTFAFA